jgi:sterol 3beta-glucosyltransferase
MKIVILTVGTRGDVQPFLALAVGLQQAGHRVTLVAPDNFVDWIRSQGVSAHPVSYNAQEFGRRPEVRAVMKSGNLIRAYRIMREFMDTSMSDALNEFWQAAQEADFVVQTPSGHGVVEVASQRGIPMAFAYLQPFAPTRAFPSFFGSALGLLRLPLGGGYNYLTHQLTDHLVWLVYGDSLNKWRAKHWGLPPWRSLSEMRRARRSFETPWLFGYSPSVLPKPPDWDETYHVTGYWFLDSRSDWQPSTDLLRFLENGPPPIYVGFGSMSDDNPEHLTRLTLRALELTGQRGILATGWGGIKELTTSANVFYLDQAPHDWLFSRMAAVVHHGGAGTTGAGLRAGVPSIITPFALDQYAWADIVVKSDVGPRAGAAKKLTAEKLAHAIDAAVNNASLRARAATLGEKIRAENGITQAVEIIERHAVEFKQRR